MKISVISFTEKGMLLSKRLAEGWQGQETALYAKCGAAFQKGLPDAVCPVTQPVAQWAGERMAEKSALVFIGACGIAVRAVAPHLKDKLSDSPVLVLDEAGAYVIPVLSGHMGGANRLAKEAARILGAAAVITTATDVRGRFAVDLFARENNLSLWPREGIAEVSARVLAGEEITICVESGHLCREGALPEGVRLVDYPPGGRVDVVVTGQEGNFPAALLLRPRRYVLGIGCRRGREEEKLEAFVQEGLRRAGIWQGKSLGDFVCAVASIRNKAKEPGLVALCQKHGIPFLTYTAEQLMEVEGVFSSSGFVRKQVGVDNVCERAALRACPGGGELVLPKYAAEGMTLAVAKRGWCVRFGEAD